MYIFELGSLPAIKHHRIIGCNKTCYKSQFVISKFFGANTRALQQRRWFNKPQQVCSLSSHRPTIYICPCTPESRLAAPAFSRTRAPSRTTVYVCCSRSRCCRRSALLNDHHRAREEDRQRRARCSLRCINTRCVPSSYAQLSTV